MSGEIRCGSQDCRSSSDVEAETEGPAMAVAVAHRALGWTCLFQGELILARSHSERASAGQARKPNMDATIHVWS